MSESHGRNSSGSGEELGDETLDCNINLEGEEAQENVFVLPPILSLLLTCTYPVLHYSAQWGVKGEVPLNRGPDS